MFKRFTAAARQAVILAQDEARRRRHRSIGPDHLLLGLLDEPDGGAAALLADLGVSGAELDAATRRMRPTGRSGVLSDGDALASIGIDLDEVRWRVEEAFGPGALDRTRAGRRRRHIPFEPAAKRALELSLREALHLRHNYIGTEHLVLGLLAGADPVTAELLRERGVTLEQARAAVVRRPGRAASG